MKKLISALLLFTLLFSFAACSKKQDVVSGTDAQKIVLTKHSDGSSVTVADGAFIKSITEHINYFDYKKIKQEEANESRSLSYTLEWFGSDDEAFKKISLFADGTGIVMDGVQYAIKGKLYLDIPYFDLIFQNFNQRTLYRLPLFLVKCLFETNSLEGFWEKEMPFYKDVEDFRKNAYLDGDAVMLFLTKAQEDAWLAHFNGGVEDFGKLDGVTLSKDYARIVIEKPKSDLEPFLFEKLPVLAPHEMVLRQILAGKDPQSIAATVVIVEEGGDTVLYSASWPHEEIAFKW
jgi:hypothetical protein